MVNERKMRVAFIGSGKVATELALIFRFHGIEITGISSRNHLSGTALSSRLNCPFVEDPNDLGAELIIIATNDSSVRALNQSLKKESFVVYTAGAVNLADFPNKNWGVFYPLQTFTENRHLTIDEVPILLESNSFELRDKLESLCKSIGLQFDYCSSEDRQKYHLAAVYVNNFVNHLIYKAQVQLLESKLNWNMLKPLIEETIAKLDDLTAFDAQTGPARRNDKSTIQTHQSLLNNEELNMYNVLTNSIQNTYNNHD
jgi:predicted short-subunit dehydrogenase-like oxidoreductase (DUF2520 family)